MLNHQHTSGSGRPASEPVDISTPPNSSTSWVYKRFRILGQEHWYASPEIQLYMVAIVCFLCPGIFNALSGLGGGGQVDPQAQDNAATALYSTFAIVGFFSGTITNRIGIKISLSLGGLGYSIYAASFLCYNHTQNGDFVIFAGALLGVCAGLLWNCQGIIMMAYPPEEKKGRYIAWFWIIFNFGCVIGALIPLGQNINRVNGPVSDGTYAAFIALMFTGALLALFLCNAQTIQRSDGSRVIMMKNPSWRTELVGLYDTIVQEPWIVLLFPMFFASNNFYIYQQNDMNAGFFNTRTRALNNLLYWLAQIFGALIFGYFLDLQIIRRSNRAKIAWGILLILTGAIWGGGYAWQRIQPPREIVEKDPSYVRVDWTDRKFLGPMFLYFFYGFFDAAWQTVLYWTMGAISNSGRKAANLTGFYKGIQAAGSTIFSRLDAIKTPYMVMFAASWGELGASLIFAAPVMFYYIRDTVSIEEDLKFSDENIEVMQGIPLDSKKDVEAIL